MLSAWQFCLGQMKLEPGGFGGKTTGLGDPRWLTSIFLTVWTLEIPKHSLSFYFFSCGTEKAPLCLFLRAVYKNHMRKWLPESFEKGLPISWDSLHYSDKHIMITVKSYTTTVKYLFFARQFFKDWIYSSHLFFKTTP